MSEFELNIQALTEIALTMREVAGSMASMSQMQVASDTRSASSAEAVAGISSKLDQVVALLTDIRDQGTGSTDNDVVDIL